LHLTEVRALLSCRLILALFEARGPRGPRCGTFPGRTGRNIRRASSRRAPCGCCEVPRARLRCSGASGAASRPSLRCNASRLAGSRRAATRKSAAPRNSLPATVRAPRGREGARGAGWAHATCEDCSLTSHTRAALTPLSSLRPQSPARGSPAAGRSARSACAGAAQPVLCTGCVRRLPCSELHQAHTRCGPPTRTGLSARRV